MMFNRYILLVGQMFFILVGNIFSMYKKLKSMGWHYVVEKEEMNK